MKECLESDEKQVSSKAKLYKDTSVREGDKGGVDDVSTVWWTDLLVCLPASLFPCLPPISLFLYSLWITFIATGYCPYTTRDFLCCPWQPHLLCNSSAAFNSLSLWSNDKIDVAYYPGLVNDIGILFAMDESSSLAILHCWVANMSSLFRPMSSCGSMSKDTMPSPTLHSPALTTGMLNILHSLLILNGLMQSSFLLFCCCNTKSNILLQSPMAPSPLRPWCLSLLS